MASVGKTTMVLTMIFAMSYSINTTTTTTTNFETTTSTTNFTTNTTTNFETTTNTTTSTTNTTTNFETTTSTANFENTTTQEIAPHSYKAYAFCIRGQYLNLDEMRCYSCPPDHFMPYQVHSSIRCKPCYHAKPNSGEIDMIKCTDTADTIVTCKKGYYFSVASAYEEKLDLMKCIPCTICSAHLYQIWPCEKVVNTLCCSDPNAIPVRENGRRGFVCNNSKDVVPDDDDVVSPVMETTTLTTYVTTQFNNHICQNFVLHIVSTVILSLCLIMSIFINVRLVIKKSGIIECVEQQEKLIVTTQKL